MGLEAAQSKEFKRSNVSLSLRTTNLDSHALGNLNMVVDPESTVKDSTKVVSFFRWMPYFVAAGCILDVLSTFFPWSEAFGELWFLPYSLPLFFGSNAQFIEENYFFPTISIAVRLAAILGLVSLLLYVYLKNILPALVLLVSIGLSFASFILFFELGWSPYLGSYLVLLGGFLKASGLILKNLEMETTEERSHNKPEDSIE